MLNIPAEIQALYKTDSVRKNFRVHFPNGESPDLTNSDIVAGSVSFTESVCSKDVLQFGLAEASRIEFECVNVPNIYGMTIECGIEVDTSSLSAADITAIQGNPGDGTLVLASASDIGYGYYRIPYGVFTVTSCPRSAGAMWKRRVEAYSDTRKPISTLLTKKLSGTYPFEAMEQNCTLLQASEKQDVTGLTFTTSTKSFTSLGSVGYPSVTMEDSGIIYSIGPTSTAYTWNHFDSTSIDALYRLTCTIDDTVLDGVRNTLESYGVPDRVIEALFRSFIRVRLPIAAGITPPVYQLSYFDDLDDTGYVYLYTGLPSGSGFGIQWVNPGGNTFEVWKDEGGVSTMLGSFTFSDFISGATLTEYTYTGTSFYIKIKQSWENQNGGTWSFANSLDWMALQGGLSEIQAQFLQTGRDGAPRYVSLSKTAPVSVNTNEYSDLWWDEYDIAPIGSINVAYYDETNDQEGNFIYEFGDGLSTYNMTDNAFLKDYISVPGGNTPETYICNLLDTYFIPNIQDVAFTPVQLSSLGLPYLEAGDYLEIDDGNGGTVGTYIMSRTLSGVQFLEDDIESKGGEIVGNVRNA